MTITRTKSFNKIGGQIKTNPFTITGRIIAMITNKILIGRKLTGLFSLQMIPLKLTLGGKLKAIPCKALKKLW